MNKFLITLATLIAFALSGFAVHAEGKISGTIQHIAGMGDDVDGGLTHKFTRFGFATDTTTDNGWTVGGSFNIEFGNLSSGGGLSAYGPTTNSMFVQTDNFTLTVGGTTGAVTNIIPRVSNMIPGAGHDGGFQFLFDGGSIAANGVNLAEAYYAQCAHKLVLALPTINGFSTSESYTPDLGFTTASAIGRSDQGTINSHHGEVAEVGISYTGEMDGISYTVGVGTLMGNSMGTLGSGSTSSNNDLSSMAGSIKITMGNISLGAHAFDNGDSWGQTEDADKASHSGYTLMAAYNMGNITVGAGYAQEEKALGTRGATSTQAGNLVARDEVTMFSVGYNMGGGVNTYVQLSNNDHDDGDHATTEVDPQVLFAGISLGF